MSKHFYILGSKILLPSQTSLLEVIYVLSASYFTI